MTTETAIQAGGCEITLTLSGSTWKTFDDTIRQAVIDGMDSDGAEAAGWDAVVKAGLDPSAVVRTSSTVATITLTAFPSYDIDATETVTATIPKSAINTGAGPVASPTFDIEPYVADTQNSGGADPSDVSIGPIELPNDDEDVFRIVRAFLSKAV